MRQPVPFGKYLLLDRISVGGMAEVFKAKSYGVEGFEKIIAIKRILPTMGEDRDFIKMFIDEAKIAGQLAHANICQIFELGRIDGSHFIAMEYIWGKDLLQIQNRVRKNKQQIPISLGCFTIAKVLEGLDYAHRKRDPLGRPLEIVHRDCSPQNVLVSYEGEVKVIDFGIAKATSRNSRTMAGVLKGKFGYMSPEQVRGLPLDRRSDIFAIGTMLYESLTGERLFQGETDFSTLEKVRNVDIAAPRSVNPNIPEVVEKIILKALAKDVDDRYQWCNEMLADLQAYLMSQDVVFTAKTLSGWLKDMFAQEIDRERQQLETYKRLGRDGLIGGVPSAEAKLDVVEHLGEAGVPEGDSTTLGGPSFDEMEAGIGAAPDVSKSPPARSSKQAAAAKPAHDEDDDSGDFGEEMPTEIFGEVEHGSAAAPTTPPPMAPRPPTSQPASRPPKPPPGRPTTQQPASMAAQADGRPGGATGQQPALARAPSANMPPSDGFVPSRSSPAAGSASPAYTAPQGIGTPNQPQPAMLGSQSGPQMAMGTPGALEVSPSSPQLQAHQPPVGQRTVLGMTAPSGLGGYGGYRPQGQDPAQPYPQQYPQQPYPPQMYPGYPPAGHSGPLPGYPMAQPNASYPATPVDPMAPVVEGKKSTLVRDIGIGVAIAAFVLVGFLVVRMVVLDNDSGAGATPPTTSTIKLSITPHVSAAMFLDDKPAAAAVSDGQEIPVTPGTRHVLLVGPNGAKCDEPHVKLEAGKTLTLQCVMTGQPPPSSTATAPADAKLPDAKPAETATLDKLPETKPTNANDKPVETKPADKLPEPKPVDKLPEPKPVDKIAETKPTKPDLKPTKPVKPADRATKQPKPQTDATNTGTKVPDSTKTTMDVKPADGSGKGYLQLFSKPSAKISVDGGDTGMSTPISGHALQLAPGKHKITFAIGDDRFSYPVVIKAGATETMTKDLQ